MILSISNYYICIIYVSLFRSFNVLILIGSIESLAHPAATRMQHQKASVNNRSMSMFFSLTSHIPLFRGNIVQACQIYL